MIKKFTILFLIGFIVFSFSLSAQGIPRFAHVDKEGLILRFLEKEEAHVFMKKREYMISKDFSDINEEYLRRLKELEENSEKDEQIVEERQRAIVDIEERKEVYMRESFKEGRKLSGQLRKNATEKVENIIKLIAEKQKFNYVFDAKSVIYSSDNMLDISEEVAEKLGFSYNSDISIDVQRFFDKNFDFDAYIEKLRREIF